MESKHHGKVQTYNVKRGFGFILLDNSQEVVFFHIKDYPSSSPVLNDRVSFSIKYENNKTRAYNIKRISNFNWPTPTKIFIFSALILSCFSLYLLFFSKENSHPVVTTTNLELLSIPLSSNEIPKTTQNFYCDGRTHCSQMTSKEEANWFVRYCPGTMMDGDNDGDACENDSRWNVKF